MKWACKQQYFDDGRVFKQVYSVSDDAMDSEKSTAGYDEYVDVFDTRAEAEEFRKQDA